MEGEHQIICKTLWKNYFMRILPGFIAFTSIFLYFSGFFVTTFVQYPLEVSNSSSSTLKDIIKATQLSLSAINNALSFQIQQYGNNTTASNLYCTANLSLQECQKSINQNPLNKLIQDRQNTSVSFRCVFGNCSEAGALWDYFWTFKLRNKFIEYIILEYTANSTHNRLVAPSLAKVTSSQIQISQNNWLLSYSNSQLCLSYHFSQTKTSAMACFDNYILKQKYKIMLNDYRFGPKYSFSIQPNITSYKSKPETFRFEILPFNLTIFVGFIAVLLLNHFHIIEIVGHWQESNFKHIQALQSIYREQLQQIFSQQQPRNSAILNQNTLQCFYEDLSEIVDGSYCSLSQYHVQEQEIQKFKYLGLLQRIKVKFQAEMKAAAQEKMNLISDIRYQLKAPIGEISDNIAKRLKQNFARAKEMHLTIAFFYFGYLALLMSIDRYQERIQNQKCLIPEAILSLFRYMNIYINSEDIKFAFKLGYLFQTNLMEELIMRLHFSLHQKFLAFLKDLDFDNHFAKHLGIQKQLKYLEESIQNKKYIFSSYLK